MFHKKINAPLFLDKTHRKFPATISRKSTSDLCGVNNFYSGDEFLSRPTDSPKIRFCSFRKAGIFILQYLTEGRSSLSAGN